MFRVRCVWLCFVATIEANRVFPSNVQVPIVCHYQNRTNGLHSMRMNSAIERHVEICPCTVAPNRLLTVSKSIVCRFVLQNQVKLRSSIDTTEREIPHYDYDCDGMRAQAVQVIA